jgi:hypothetical protein
MTMKLRHYVLAALIASASSAAVAQQPAPRGVRVASRPEAAPPPTGTILGHVGGAEAGAQPWTIIIEGGSAKREVPSNEHGQFEARVAPGVYKAYMKTPPGEGDERAEYPTFYVRPGGVAKIQVDLAYEYFYCTKSGEKVIPVQSSRGEAEDRRGLRRPRYDSYDVKESPKVTKTFVVQHCGRTPLGKFIRYKSPTFMFGDAWLTFEQASLSRLGFEVNGEEGTLYRHGEPAVSVPTAGVRFPDGQPFVNFTGMSAFSAKGDGEIGSGVATFDVKVDDRGVKKLEYKDLSNGLKLSSSGKEGCILITESAENGLTIAGSAVVTKPGSARGEVHDFKVTLQDRGSENKGEDQFSISISLPGLKDYQKSGVVTSGDIDVSGNLRKSGRQGARAATSVSSSRLNVPARMPVRMRRP